MKYSELHRILRDTGCFIVRNGGSHPIWKSPITGLLFETGYHESQEVRKGTLKKIAKRSGIKL
ncbi:MAG: type II toxin-antitoxin system HicA family toxin [Bacteroidales bacterium]|nr:type II toxin-antitoxin system HicA family toxin [Bacteroidales bacterium]